MEVNCSELGTVLEKDDCERHSPLRFLPKEEEA